jgi:hypothetical protein
MVAANDKSPVKTEIKLGEPRVSTSGLEFHGTEHPALDAAKEQGIAAYEALEAKLSGSDAYKKDLAEFEKAFGERHEDSLQKAFDAKTPAEMNKIIAPIEAEKAAKVDALMKTHAGDEFKKFAAARDAATKAQHELNALELAKLKGMDVTKIPGYDAATHGELVKKHIAAQELSVKAAGKFGILRTEGIGNAIGHNVGGEAWRTHKGKAFAHTTGVALGAVMAADALFRSETKDKDGNAQKRGAIGRWTEFVLGAGVAAGSALHGHR